MEHERSQCENVMLEENVVGRGGICLLRQTSHRFTRKEHGTLGELFLTSSHARQLEEHSGTRWSELG